jgi:hypothetical protein
MEEQEDGSTLLRPKSNKRAKYAHDTSQTGVPPSKSKEQDTCCRQIGMDLEIDYQKCHLL